MAVERIQKGLTLNLSEFVLGRFTAFKELRRDTQIRLEAEFAQRVIDEDLDYRQQMRVRQGMVSTEKDRAFPDTQYINEIKKEISNVRKLVKFQQVRTAYLNSWTDYKSGTTSINAYLTQLQNQLATTTDDTLLAELRKELSQARIDKRTAENNILNNRVVFAQEDGSEETLNDILSELKISRASEAAKGNEERVSFIDTKISSVNKQLSESIVGRSLADTEFNILKGGANPGQKLKTLNDQIQSSDTGSPVTIGGVRYDSAQQYWTVKRNAYLAGEGVGLFDDFFGELTSRFEAEISSSSNVNEFGRVPDLVLDNILNDYASFESLPYMAPFLERLRNNRNGVINTAVKKSANAIIEDANARGDFVNVDQSLNEIEQKYQIDLTSFRARASVEESANIVAKSTTVRRRAEEELFAAGVRSEDPDFEDLVIGRLNQITGGAVGDEIVEKELADLGFGVERAGFTAPEKSLAERRGREVAPEEKPEEKTAEEPAPLEISSVSTIEDIEKFLETKQGAPIIFKGEPTQFIRVPGEERFNVLKGLRSQEELERAKTEKTVKAEAVELPVELKALFKIESPFFDQ